jgi:hypothetical protein
MVFILSLIGYTEVVWRHSPPVLVMQNRGELYD